mmetsp:Transcript_168/g.363  ORF Transcript_168/g.363 Transcript_168/m.363 type:complete len:106 (-) Transcript_168:13-330(-)
MKSATSLAQGRGSTISLIPRFFLRIVEEPRIRIVGGLGCKRAKVATPWVEKSGRSGTCVASVRGELPAPALNTFPNTPCGDMHFFPSGTYRELHRPLAAARGAAP